ncbi:transglutaminaseTgpA domain-containing protein [Microbacterium sp. PA5]|uniref:transglutaminase family protein n=1 Tax=Microbacterium sp. PA5 TaxID=3416654 RepID=UPI003CF24464
MSLAETRAGRPATARPLRRGDRRLSIMLWLGLCAAIAPLLGVVSPGPWLLGALAMSAGLLAVGATMRRLRVPAVGVTLAEVVVWAGAVTAVFFARDAFLGLIPTPDVVDAVTTAIQQASAEILLGVAPMEASAALSFVIVAAIGALTIALDHVVLTARMPLLASIALVAVWLIPAIAVPSGMNVLGFAILAAAVLALIRAETRTREAPEPGSSAGVTAVAATIGVVTVVATLISAPALPAPIAAGSGSGALATIDPTLDLGNDLRRRGDVAVLTVRTDGPTLPYLRVATLSEFDGEIWRPDRVRSVSLWDEGMEPVVVDEGIRVTQYRTNIAISNLSSSYLPVSYPAVSVDGLEGLWRTVPYSRTVLSGQASTQGQRYEVVSQVPRPTLEQIRAAEADADGLNVDVRGLPDSTPARVAELAEQVTADARTDYDRLTALQDWFRGPDFTYSLRAPVLEGFDGTGSDAVAAFLEVREGYCIHFAGAFALMARALDMPSRIVVGFLPGTYTGDTEDGQRVAEVTTGQLHAWPEVHFEGVGWVPFEPTKSLGNETRFLPASEAGQDDGGEDISGPTPTTTPTSTASAAPNERPDDGPTDAAGSTLRLVDLRPYLLTVGGVILVGVLPLVLRTLRRRSLGRRAAEGDAGAAWRMLQEAAIDLGVTAPAAESPRAFGARLVASHLAPAEEVSRLVAGIERASYSRDGLGPAALADDAEAARAAMLAAATPAARAMAVLLPRSLVVRPGSAFAGSAPVVSD